MKGKKLLAADEQTASSAGKSKVTKSQVHGSILSLIG